LFFLYITLQNTISKQINKKNYIKITNNNPKTIWNLQGTPSASWNSVQQDFWAREQWRRVFPRATVTGGAWTHAPPQATGNSGIGLTLFSPSLSCRR
jgi:hypothetical protein